MTCGLRLLLPARSRPGSECVVTVVDPPTSVWRIGRRLEPLAYSRISQLDAAQPNAGNRFDVPGGTVLYAATLPEACFVETLAKFRPAPGLAGPLHADAGYMPAGSLPAAWRDSRVLVEISFTATLPFVDIDDTETLLDLDQELAPALRAAGVQQLDRGVVYSANRVLTRMLSSWVYAQTDVDGHPLYGGLRYESRLGQQWECWAIFDGTSTHVTKQSAINRDNVELNRVAGAFGLTVR